MTSPWRPHEPSLEAERTARHSGWVHPEDCVCGGHGWVWGFELPGGESPPTDTRYQCPYQESK